MKHDFKFFCISAREWKPIPGPVYWVNLPIALQIPALKDNMLIVHHFIKMATPNAWRVFKWTVSHADTGGLVARGKTRAEAMQNAKELLLQIGNDKYLLAIERYREKLGELQKQTP